MDSLQELIIDKTNIAECLECDCRNAYVEIEKVHLDFGVHWFRGCGVPEWYVNAFKEKCNPGILNSFEMAVIALEENTIHPLYAIQIMLQRALEITRLLDKIYADVVLESYELQL